MRLFEVDRGKRPRRAGKAVLEYENITQPVRHGDVITIPDTGSLEMFKLQVGWRQFLVHIANQGGLWFGGTDENPFLVRMDHGMFPDFLSSPTSFYDKIRPTVIRKLLSIYPRAAYVRQGDIFAFRLPFSFNDIKKAMIICHWANFGVDSVSDYRVFNTRHTLTGSVTQLKSCYSLLGGLASMLVDGVLTAPDHSAKVLSGPHVVAQTAYLHDPEAAD